MGALRDFVAEMLESEGPLTATLCADQCQVSRCAVPDQDIPPRRRPGRGGVVSVVRKPCWQVAMQDMDKRLVRRYRTKSSQFASFPGRAP